MKRRAITKSIKKAIKTFPAMVLTGPRQSGKTTLLKSLFSSSHSYVTLEDPDIRMRAKEDPRAFLEENSPPIIIDEIQYVPNLLPYIKTRIDQKRTPGQWLFTGSQNFALMHNVSQSLAGRAAILSLLPFSLAEQIGQGAHTIPPQNLLKMMGIKQVSSRKINLPESLLRGFYPEICANKKVDRSLWCGSYISTYLERDVRNLVNIGDLSQFERFVKMCAIRTGQILNISDLARDIGISTTTAKRWLSILETGYQIYLLYPYYNNLGKRLIKSPKLYFNDTGLATYLLGIHDKETLLKSPNFGAIFETFIVNDFLKRFLHAGQMPSMYYLRTRDGMEIDLVIEIEQKLYLFEIKSAMTIFPKQTLSLQRAAAGLKGKVGVAATISRSEKNSQLTGKIFNISWKNLLAV